MIKQLAATAALAAVLTLGAAAHAQPGPTDPLIAHIAYTAGVIDIAAAKQALAKSHDKRVLDFANEMVRDHQAVNDQALALVKRLNVTPEANPTSASLTAAADAERAKLSKLDGRSFDRAYVDNEVAYHHTVNGALAGTLIPDAHNTDLKSLLTTGLKLFQQHEEHARMLAAELK